MFAIRRVKSRLENDGWPDLDEDQYGGVKNVKKKFLRDLKHEELKSKHLRLQREFQAKGKAQAKTLKWQKLDIFKALAEGQSVRWWFLFVLP